MNPPPLMPEWAWNAAAILVGAIVGALVAGFVAWTVERKRLKWEAKEARRRFAAALDPELEILTAGAKAAVQVDDPLAAMTTLACLRPNLTVFLHNTDKIGLFESDLASGILGAYYNMQHWIDRGEKMSHEVDRVENNSQLREPTLAELRKNAAHYIPGIQSWIKRTCDLRQELGQLVGTDPTNPAGTGRPKSRNDRHA